MDTTRKTITSHYAEHVANCQRDWETAMEKESFNAVLIHSGSQIYSFLDDYHYPFRPNPHFLHWLPLTHHHDSALLVRPGQKPLLFYYQPDDYWYTAPADPESWWADHFEVRAVRNPDAWNDEGFTGGTAFIGDSSSLAKIAGQDLNPERLINRMHLARTRKTAYEISCIAESNRLAAVSHRAAESAFRAGCSEYEIHQIYCQAAGQVDHQLPYGNIVALNQHGAILHYQDHALDKPEAIHSFLIDAGATQQGYASDITRTYSADADEFADLIAAMNTVQLDLCDGMRVDVDYRDMHLQAHAKIAELLVQFEIINGSAEAAVNTGLSAVFYPHGLGHFLGLQTHDVAGLIADAAGTPVPRPEGHPFLRLTRTLEAGNVLTVEPGLYFIDTLLEKWKAASGERDINWERIEQFRKFGGIRIEDNIVVTESGPVNLSRDAFAAL